MKQFSGSFGLSSTNKWSRGRYTSWAIVERLSFPGDHSLRRFRICVALLIWVSIPALAQQPWPTLSDSGASESGPAPDTTHGMIRLDVNVSDKSGNPVSGLTQQDFTLLDNGHPEKIVTFEEGLDDNSDAPTEVILVIDELNLLPLQVADAEREAENFLRQRNGHLSLPVAVYRLNPQGLSASAPSTDGDALADQIANKKEPLTIWKTSALSASMEQIVEVQGSTSREVKEEVARSEVNNLHSVVALGSIALKERRKSGRKLLFWLSSGWKFDGQPGPGMFDLVTELSTRLREARIDLWIATSWASHDGQWRPSPVGTLSHAASLQGITPDTLDFSALFLKSFVFQAGGGLLETGRDLSGKIEQRIRKESTFYSLTFDPPPTNVVDEYHSLKVEVDKPDLIVRTTIGYFDEPVFYDQPPLGLQRVSVEQLEDALKAGAISSGDEMKRNLSHMELTERLNTERLAKLQSTLKNKSARGALSRLADESAFLPPPSSEIPAIAPPDAAAQQQIIARAIIYVDQTTRRLPNLYAERTAIEYDQHPAPRGQTWKTAGGDQSLYQDQTSKATVVFRDGKEIEEAKVTRARLLNKNDENLNTVGTFGAVLTTAIVGASESGSQLGWSRWENGSNGPLAVFHYRVPRETPLYLVSSNFLTINDLVLPFTKKSRYHGEFAIDPASGAILRLTIQADPEKRLPLQRADVMVEYAPVVIGGITYVCPKRSVSISRSRTTMDIHEWGDHFRVYAPFETKLLDMTYNGYHLLHPTSRMLPGFKPVNE